MRAIVVFHGHGLDGRWTGRLSRALAPGFRHCFVCIEDAAGVWIRLDGRAGIPELRAVAGPGFDLAGFYRDAGFTAVALKDVRPRPPRTPLMLGTCVGAAKRVLGLRAPLVLTPRQLWRYLTFTRKEPSWSPAANRTC